MENEKNSELLTQYINERNSLLVRQADGEVLSQKELKRVNKLNKEIQKLAANNSHEQENNGPERDVYDDILEVLKRPNLNQEEKEYLVNVITPLFEKNNAILSDNLKETLPEIITASPDGLRDIEAKLEYENTILATLNNRKAKKAINANERKITAIKSYLNNTLSVDQIIPDMEKINYQPEIVSRYEFIINALKKSTDKKNLKKDSENKIQQLTSLLAKHKKVIAGTVIGIGVVSGIALFLYNEFKNNNNYYEQNVKPAYSASPMPTETPLENSPIEPSIEPTSPSLTPNPTIAPEKEENEKDKLFTEINNSIEKVIKVNDTVPTTKTEEDAKDNQKVNGNSNNNNNTNTNSNSNSNNNNNSTNNSNYHQEYKNDYQEMKEIYNLTKDETIDLVNRAHIISDNNFYEGASIREIVEVLYTIDRRELYTSDSSPLSQFIKSQINLTTDNYLFGNVSDEDIKRVETLKYFAKENSDLQKFLTNLVDIEVKILKGEENAQEEMYNYIRIFATSLNVPSNEPDFLTDDKTFNENAQVVNYYDFYMAYHTFIAPLLPTFSNEETWDKFSELEDLILTAFNGPEFESLCGDTLTLGGE